MKLPYSDLPSFETLRALAQNDPEALEALRLELVQEVIEFAPSPERKRRLEGLNFVVEMNRRKATNPMQSCLKISELMWDSAVTLADKIHNPQG